MLRMLKGSFILELWSFYLKNIQNTSETFTLCKALPPPSIDWQWIRFYCKIFNPDGMEITCGNWSFFFFLFCFSAERIQDLNLSVEFTQEYYSFITPEVCMFQPSQWCTADKRTFAVMSCFSSALHKLREFLYVQTQLLQLLWIRPKAVKDWFHPHASRIRERGKLKSAKWWEVL